MITSRPNKSKSAVAALVETYRQGFLRLDPELLDFVWYREHDHESAPAALAQAAS